MLSMAPALEIIQAGAFLLCEIFIQNFAHFFLQAGEHSMHDQYRTQKLLRL